MTGKPIAAALAAMAALAVLAATGCGEPLRERAAGGAAPAEAAPSVESPDFLEGINQMDVTLYFLRPDGEALAPEIRSIFRTADELDRARQTLQALLDGPEGDLIASVPPGTRLMEIFLTGDGTAWVDLGPEFVHGLGSGSSDAVWAVYAIVNTLTWNFPGVKAVKILVDGDEAGVIGGHVDLSYPILPEMGFVDLSPFETRAYAGPPVPEEGRVRASPPRP